LKKVSLHHLGRVIDAGALPLLIAILNSKADDFDRSADILYQTARLSDEYRDLILSDALQALLLNHRSRNTDKLLVLLNQASGDVLVSSFSLLLGSTNQSPQPNKVYRIILDILSTAPSLLILQSFLEVNLVTFILDTMEGNADLLVHESCREILLNFFILSWHPTPINQTLLHALSSFKGKGSRRKGDLKLLYLCIWNLVQNCSCHQSIIDSGLIKSLFNRELCDDLLVSVHEMTLYVLESNDEDLLDHFLHCGLLSFFVSALKSKNKLKKMADEDVIKTIQLIMRRDKRYFEMVRTMKLPRLLVPLLMKGSELDQDTMAKV
jgi:hypothetical protein